MNSFPHFLKAGSDYSGDNDFSNGIMADIINDVFADPTAIQVGEKVELNILFDINNSDHHSKIF